MDESELKFAQANDMILKLVPPFFIVLGTVSNIISMIITSKKVNMSSFMMFVFTINILDTVGLYTEPFWLFIHHWINNDATQSVIAGKVVLCIYNFVVICTGWITFYTCFEQASKLCFEAKGLITRKKGIFLLVTTVLVSCGTNLYFVLNEQNYVEEVSMSSMMSSFQGRKADTVSHETREVTSLAYKFNWRWLNKLLGCFFPLTFTLACLIAIKQGMKTVIQNETSATQVIRGTLSLKEQENVKLACATGIMLIVSTAPLTFFKTQVSDLKSAKVQLICTCLSILVHMNFAMKLVYFCIVSSLFRRNVCCIFKRGVIARQIRKLSTFQDHSAVELLSNGEREVRVCLEEACSDTDSNMSASPTEKSETVEFCFNRESGTFKNVESNRSEC